MFSQFLHSNFFRIKSPDFCTCRCQLLPDVSLTDPLTSPARLSVRCAAARAGAALRAQMADTGHKQTQRRCRGQSLSPSSPSPPAVIIIRTAAAHAETVQKPIITLLGKFLWAPCKHECQVYYVCVIPGILTVMWNLEDGRMTWTWSRRMIM